MEEPFVDAQVITPQDYVGAIMELCQDKRGTFRYGSPHVTLVADNTEPETLAATGYDDDGVACQRWDVVREGLFVGYCTNREVALKIGETRSRGWALPSGLGSGEPILRTPFA